MDVLFKIKLLWTLNIDSWLNIIFLSIISFIFIEYASPAQVADPFIDCYGKGSLINEPSLWAAKHRGWSELTTFLKHPFRRLMSQVGDKLPGITESS